MKHQVQFTCDKCGTTVDEEMIYTVKIWGGNQGKGLNESFDLCSVCAYRVADSVADYD